MGIVTDLKWSSGKVALGVQYIIDYLERENMDHPLWLDQNFYKLPRCIEQQFRYRVLVDQKDFGECCVWIVDELNGRWSSIMVPGFLFENEQDAVLFKLRWG